MVTGTVEREKHSKEIFQSLQVSLRECPSQNLSFRTDGSSAEQSAPTTHLYTS